MRKMSLWVEKRLLLYVTDSIIKIEVQCYSFLHRNPWQVIYCTFSSETNGMTECGMECPKSLTFAFKLELLEGCQVRSPQTGWK